MLKPGQCPFKVSESILGHGSSLFTPLRGVKLMRDKIMTIWWNKSRQARISAVSSVATPERATEETAEIQARLRVACVHSQELRQATPHVTDKARTPLPQLH